MNQRLELTWVGKDKKLNLEPRILIEDIEKSYGDKETENMLIHGDNLLALKALEQDYTEKIKCIYIDPPYNTGNAFEHYDDNLEHSIWLNLMKPRLELLKKLLHKEGILAVQIDDNEYAKLYLLLAEIFGEKNLKTIVVKMSEATGVKMSQVKKVGNIPKLKEYIILASKNGIRGLKVEKIPKDKWDNEYKTLILNGNKNEIDRLKAIIDDENRNEHDIKEADDICGKFEFKNVNEFLDEIGLKKKDEKENWLYENSWRIIRTCSTTGKAKELADQKKKLVSGSSFIIETPQKKAYVMLKQYNEQSTQPRIKLLFADDYLTVHPGDFWSDIKTTGLGNEGGVDFTNGKKPESLLKRIIGMSTNEGDIVLDSFLGSGTTVAVAHKMNRKWIGIELGEHCYSHCITRLKSVIDGSDEGGITKVVNWQGGGGFKFYELAPSLLNRDVFGNWVINKEYNAERLSNALCKIQGFKYEPDQEIYWKQGFSNEKDYIYVTTNFITVEHIDKIYSEMKENESLLICCKSYQKEVENRYNNINIKRIPQAILDKCEFSNKSYNLNIKSIDFGDNRGENNEKDSIRYKEQIELEEATK